MRKILGILCFISMLVMASECGDTNIFIISHVIACLVFVLCAKALIGGLND